MTGRIKLLNNGIPLSTFDTPSIGYRYDMISSFDKACGTNDLEEFQLPNRDNQCPDRFVCTSPTTSPTLKSYAKCIDAMNCHMVVGMTTGVASKSPKALFLHQMIPHHQNAVNMAKTLLVLDGEIVCDDVTDEDSPDCAFEVLLRGIVNNQNFQIQQMFGILKEENFVDEDDCDVPIERNLRLAGTKSGHGMSQSRALRYPSDVVRLEAPERRMQSGICISATNMYTVVVDLLAGELGT
jgi:Domain of unknown function (DUF305)